MCSNCNRSICGSRSAIAYERANCSCGGSSENIAVPESGCGNSESHCRSCACGIIDSLSQGFACTAFQIARGLDRSLSCGCGGNGSCGCH